MDLKSKLHAVVLEYTKQFYMILIDEPYDEDNAYWIGRDILGVCGIGDYFVNLSDMVMVVDNNVSGEDFSEWYWRYVGDISRINKEYVSLRNYLLDKGYKLN